MAKDFYNALAPYYKLVYQDWGQSAERQAAQLDSLIVELFGIKKVLLDAACGVGTQCIGLAAHGYEVSASDVAEEELALAREEAEARGLAIDFRVADMREVSTGFDRRFDVVLCADNSIAHLLDDDEILKALRAFFDRLNPGGGCLVTVRDYAELARTHDSCHLHPRRVCSTPEGKLVMFDLWEFEGEHYDLNMYIVRDSGSDAPDAKVFRSRCYCVSTERLESLMTAAGFVDVQTIKGRFFQPVVAGSKPA